MLRLLPTLAFFLLLGSVSHSQHLHHYVASVQGINTNAQEKELLHFLRMKDPNGRYVIDATSGDVTIHTTTFMSEQKFGSTVNSCGLILLHFREVRPEALPRRRRNSRSA